RVARLHRRQRCPEVEGHRPVEHFPRLERFKAQETSTFLLQFAPVATSLPVHASVHHWKSPLISGLIAHVVQPGHTPRPIRTCRTTADVVRRTINSLTANEDSTQDDCASNSDQRRDMNWRGGYAPALLRPAASLKATLGNCARYQRLKPLS